MKVIRILEHDGPDEVVRATLRRSLDWTYMAGGQRITSAIVRPEDLALMVESDHGLELGEVLEHILSRGRSKVWNPEQVVGGEAGHEHPVLPATEWVPVNIELPPDEREVVTYDARQRRIVHGRLIDGAWVLDGSDFSISRGPTHWLRILAGVGGER